MPDGPPPPPVVQRVRLRYAKRDRLRFTSHRDFARAFERALRRADVPIAYSAGFSPHPKVSYVGAAPTGVASEAEFLEVGLASRVEVGALRSALDRALPPGLDILDGVEASAGSLADRIDGSEWEIVLPGVEPERVRSALEVFWKADAVEIDRRTKSGLRKLDVRSAVISTDVSGDSAADPSGAVRRSGVSASADGGACAIIVCVVRHSTPAVRPDDLLTGLRLVADLDPAVFPVPPRATRLAQGTLTAEGRIVDPLDADRGGVAIGTPV